MDNPEDITYISWSALRVWETCKQKSYLKRIGTKTGVQETRNFFHGNVVDRAMRNWLEDPIPGKLVSSIDQHFEELESEIRTGDESILSWRDASDKDAVRAFCIELALRLEPILVEYVLPYDYQPAMRFKVPILIPDKNGKPRAVVLRGEFDLLLKNHESLFEIWDLKATANNDYWRKTMGQLVFYDIAVMSMFEQSKSARVGLFQPMCKLQIFEFVVTDQQRRELLQRLVAYAHSMWADERDTTENKNDCYGCEVAFACTKFAPVGNGKRVSLGLPTARSTISNKSTKFVEE